jgi:hypothetical protein
MRRVSQIISLVLLALWFPATQCCALEAAGVGLNFCCDEGCTGDDVCAKDACATLGTVPYKSGGATVKVPAPALRDVATFVAVALPPPMIEAMVSPSTPVVERPADWVVVWQFVRRAAPPARAPALRCA